MLNVVDIPVLVMEHTGNYHQQVLTNLQGHKNLLQAKGSGPEGWSSAVLELLSFPPKIRNSQ
jgi:hypothetical protein